MVHWINPEGKISTAPPRLDFLDPAVQFGAAGAFETLRVERRRVHRWAAHRGRLELALEFLRLDLAFGWDALLDLMARELGRFDPESGLRLRVTVGGAPGGETPYGRMRCRAFAEARPLEPACTGPVAERPALSLHTFRDYPVASDDPWRRHKTTQYFGQYEARRRARSLGYDEALLLNERGEVVETTGHNLFWIRDGRILTPPVNCGALPGTFRACLVEAAQGLGLAVGEEVAVPEELVGAEALFLTNAIGEVRSVTNWDGRDFPALGSLEPGRALLGGVEAGREARGDLDLAASPPYAGPSAG